MRRLLAACVVLIFVGSPIAQWECAIACALDDAPAGDVCRHAVPTIADHVIEPDHDCGAHDATPVVVTRPAHAVAIGSVSRTQPVADLVAVALTPSTSSHACLGSPPGHFVLPIRV